MTMLIKSSPAIAGDQQVKNITALRQARHEARTYDPMRHLMFGLVCT